MRVVVHWSGGKECCLAYHKVIEQGHDVSYLLTFVYAKPYIFHSFPIMELQSKSLGIPQLKVKVKDSYQDIFEALRRLKKKDGIEGIVVGDIVGAGCARIHQIYYDIMCGELGINLIMPLENPSGDTYDVLNEEILTSIRPIMTCINLDYFGEEWLGRELDRTSIKDLKTLADRHGIDVCSEDGRGYHTMVVDAPFFKEAIEISKFSKETSKEKKTTRLFTGIKQMCGKETSKEKKKTWLYMNIKEAFLRPKK